MPTYILVLAYQGTHYYGWQIQPDRMTVTQVLVNTFYAAFKRHITITGASRTDTGVHALGQVAAFQTDLVIDPQTMLRAWNNILPAYVLIRKIELHEQVFSPRRDVAHKVYYYHFFTRRPLPFFSPYGPFIYKSLDRDLLKKCLAVFQGTHDFRSFCTGYEKENTVRRIDSIELIYLKQYRCYRISIKGPGFLKYMIRRIVGACFHVATTPGLSEDLLRKSLEQKTPVQLYKTAPACGLMLAAVRYNTK